MTRKELDESLKKALGIDTLPSMVNAQVNKYVTERGWSYEQIARAFAYFVVVKQGRVDPKFGIGIVPSVMDEAMDFFRRKEEKEMRQKAQVRRMKNAEQDSIICTQPLRRLTPLRTKIRLDELWEDNDGDNE